MTAKQNKGTSLAKGPVAIIGMILLAYGVTALIFGGRSFASNPLGGTVDGKTWLGLEVNGWSDLLFIGSGALLMFGSPLHWGAKTLSLVVGFALAAAAVISLIDGDDVLGIFAANGRTTLVWAIVAAVLIVLALLPRVGGDKGKDDDGAGRRRTTDDDERIAERSARERRDELARQQELNGRTERGSVSATKSDRSAR